MSFAGTVFDMIQRSKFNEEQKKSNRLRRAKVKESYLKHLSYSGISHIKESTLSAAEMELLKSKIRKKIHREKIISLIRSIAILIVLILLPLILYFNFFD